MMFEILFKIASAPCNLVYERMHDFMAFRESASSQDENASTPPSPHTWDLGESWVPSSANVLFSLFLVHFPLCHAFKEQIMGENGYSSIYNLEIN